MKKKLTKIILVAALAAGLVFGMTACNNSNNDSIEAIDASKTMKISDVHQKNLAGLKDYLKGNGVIAGGSVEMMADVIGAKEGIKYHFRVEDTQVLVELYEFDTENLNDTAKTILKDIKENGQFTVPGFTTSIPAKISENGKYIYTNSDTGTNDADVAFQQKLEECFNTYAKEESTIKVEKQKDESSSENASSDSSSEASSEAASEASSEAASQA